MSNDKTNLADVQPGGRVRLEQEPRDHRWDDVGERCLDCGDKDWMGGACSGPRAPEITAPWSPIGMAPNDGEPHIRGLWVTSRIDGAPATREWRQFIGLVNDDGAFVDPDYGETFGWEADQFDAWMPLADAPGAALSAQPSPGGNEGDSDLLAGLRAAEEYLYYGDCNQVHTATIRAAFNAIAARQPVRIYGCCAQPEGELHTAECPNLRHLAARQSEGSEEAHILPPLANERMLDAGWPYGEVINASFDREGAYADLLSAAPPVGLVQTFQAGVAEWMGQCFLPSLYSNMTERGDRLLEEVLELLQAHGYDSARVPTLVDYVFGRPVGEPAQEVGGVMVTLAGYCWVAGLDMHAAGDAELARITQPEVMAKIRAKQEAKNALHFDTPLPGGAASAQAVDLPYSLDVDPAGIRARVCDVITGTLMVGAQGHTPPPAGHWAEPFWKAARADATALAVDLGALVAELAEADREYSEAKKKYYTVSAKSSAAGGRAACSAAYQREVTAKARLDAAVRALIDSQAVGK